MKDEFLNYFMEIKPDMNSTVDSMLERCNLNKSKDEFFLEPEMFGFTPLPNERLSVEPNLSQLTPNIYEKIEYDKELMAIIYKRTLSDNEMKDVEHSIIPEEDKKAFNRYHKRIQCVGSVRNYIPIFLDWLNIPRSTLPFEKIFILAGMDVAGRISKVTFSNGNTDLWLYISNDVFFPLESVKYVVSHELTHLYLSLKDYQNFPQPLPITDKFEKREEDRVFIKEEYETEVAAMCLGFGKLMLNGICKYIINKTNNQLGYFSLSEYVKIFNAVNEKLDIPKSISTIGLNNEALDALKNYGVD